jgi:RNA polymerase sigma-70 factor (ECF subfamily)
MLSPTDKYLLESIQRGDEKAFEILFTCYYTSLCRYATGIVHIKETAEDIVAELFAKVWEQPETFMVKSSLRNYLFRCIHNSCLNYLNRTLVKYHELNTETTDKLNDLITYVEDDHVSMNLFASEFEERLTKAINKLPTECARVFIMSRMDGLSHKDIAKILDISENTVKVQIYRALTKLRELLKEFLD